MESPKYIHFSDKQRNEFLSQIGHFSFEERQVFSKLCDSWEVHISYREIYEALTKQSVKHAAALQALMKKLEVPEVGLIRSQIIDKSLQPHYIILTEEGSSLFWHEYLAEWIDQCLFSPMKALPLHSEITQAHAKYPQKIVRAISFDELIAVTKGTSESADIFQLSLDEAESILVPQQQISQLINVLILKLRYFLRSGNTLSKLSQAMNTPLHDVQKFMAGRNLRTWQEISKAITKIIVKNTGSDVQSRSNKELYYYAIYLYQYSEALQKVHTAEQKETQARESDYLAILTDIKNAGKHPISKHKFDSVIHSYEEKYANHFSAFHRGFIETYTAPITSAKIPLVMIFEKGFIHKDNIFLYFYDNYLHLCQELAQYYHTTLTENLQSTRFDEMFLSSKDFETSIKNEAKIRNAFVAIIIEKQLFLAEAIMHHVQISSKHDKLKDAERLLSHFFFPESMSLKSYQEIFNLDVKKIYAQAFKKLGFFRKIWMKLNGRHASLLEKFSEQFKGEEPMPDESEWASASEDLQKNYLLNRLNPSRPSNEAPASREDKMNPSPKKEPLKETSKGKYTSEEIDKFWDNFKNSMK